MVSDVTDAESTTASVVTSLSTHTASNQLGNVSVNSECTSSFVSATDASKDDEYTIYRGGKSYKRGDALPAKRKKRTHWIWTKGEELYAEKDKKYYWMCSMCLEDNSFKKFASTSITWIIQHMKEAHMLTEDGPIGSIEVQVAPAENIDGSVFKYISIIDFERLTQRLIEWIVVMHIAFSQVENKWFRQFLEVLNPMLTSWIPTSGDTVRNWILAEFKRRYKDIKK